VELEEEKTCFPRMEESGIYREVYARYGEYVQALTGLFQ